MEGSRWLADLLAVPAGELLAHRLDYLPLARNDLQRLGNVLAHFHDPGRATAGAGRRSFNDQPFARQVVGKRLAGGPTAFEGGDTCDPLRNASRRDLVFGGICLEFLKLQFHLVDQPGSPFRALAILLTAQLGDLKLEVPDHRLRRRHDSAHLCEISLGRSGTRFGFRECGPQSGYLRSGIIHGKKLPCNDNQPAFEGRCVQRGLRQSIPSRR